MVREKRYSQFYELRKAILREVEGTAWFNAKRAFTAIAGMSIGLEEDSKLVEVPPLPPKKWFGSSIDESFVIERAEGIASFLWEMSQRPDLCCLSCVQAFLRSNVQSYILNDDDVQMYTKARIVSSQTVVSDGENCNSSSSGVFVDSDALSGSDESADKNDDAPTEKNEYSDPWTSRLRIRSFGDVTRILFGRGAPKNEEFSDARPREPSSEENPAVIFEKEIEEHSALLSSDEPYVDLNVSTVSTPKLRFAIVLVGSRGDVQPYVALGKSLIERGHSVRIATHECFRKFVTKHGIEFFALPGDPKELMEIIVQYGLFSPRLVTSGVATKQRKWVRALLSAAWDAVTLEIGQDGKPIRPHRHETNDSTRPSATGTGVAYSQLKSSYRADVIIANPPSFAGWHLAEALGCALYMSFPMPWSRTKAFPSPFTSVNQPFPWINYMSFGTVERLIWLGISDVINEWRVQTLKLKPIWTLSARGHRLLHDHAVPFIYPWSDKILPKPSDWETTFVFRATFFLVIMRRTNLQIPRSMLAKIFCHSSKPGALLYILGLVVSSSNAQQLFAKLSWTRC